MHYEAQEWYAMGARVDGGCWDLKGSRRGEEGVLHPIAKRTRSRGYTGGGGVMREGRE